MESEAGISEPVLCYHFAGGRERLFVETAHRSLEGVLTGLEGSMGRVESGAGKLNEASRWLIEEGARGHPVNEMYEVARLSYAEHHTALEKGFRRSLHGPMSGAIAVAVASGELS